jgi:hypothetical protein
MSNRKDICTPRKKSDGGTYWVKIGTAWENDKGIQLVFDALPIADAEGRCVANLFDPKPRDGAQRDQQHRDRLGSGPRMDDLDDTLPPF